LKPVKQASPECLRIQYEELKAIGEQAKTEGVYAHLLTKEVAERILNGLPPIDREALRAKIGKPATSPSADNPQSSEMLWEYVWRWQLPQPPPACPVAVKVAPPVKKGVKRCLVKGCKGASHQLVECEKFLGVGPINRYIHCLMKRRCIICLGQAHEWSSWTGAGRPPCLEAAPEIGGCARCGSWHQKMVACPHQVSPAAAERTQLATSACVVGPLRPRPVQMLAQRVETCGGEDFIFSISTSPWLGSWRCTLRASAGTRRERRWYSTCNDDKSCTFMKI
jgi:hypothetical protein